MNENGSTEYTAMSLGRRQVLAGLFATGAVSALSGCVGDGESVDGAVDEDPDVFALPFPHIAENTQLNPWAGSYPSDVHSIFFEVPALSTPDGTYHTTPLVEDVQTNDQTVTVTYASGFRWWNGEPVTARDRWVDERIRSFVAGNNHDDETIETFDTGSVDDVSLESVSLRDEYTIEYEFDQPLARQLALDRVLGGAHEVPAWYFEPWLDQLVDTETDDDRESVVTDLRHDRVPLETAMEEGFGCGPYELVEVSPNRLIMDPYENHPGADELEIPRLWLPVGMDQQIDEMINDGVIGGHHGILTDRATSPPDTLEQLARYHARDGIKFSLNWRNPHLARAGVRQALLCVLPLEDIARIGEWGDPATTQTGLTKPQQERWLDDSVLDTLEHYPVDNDEALAADYMRAENYSRDGGTWYDGDGNPVEFRLRSPLWHSWAAAMELVVTSLEDFGFEPQFDDYDSTTFISYVLEGNYDIAPWWTDGSPFYAYDITDADPGTLGYGLDGTSDVARLGKPLEPTVPASFEGNTDDESIDLRQLTRTVRHQTDEADSAIETIARWWNHALPDIDIATSVTGMWGNTHDFSWPGGDDPRYQRTDSTRRAEIELLKRGAIRPTGVDGTD